LLLKLDCDYLVTDFRFPAELQLSGKGFLLLSFELRSSFEGFPLLCELQLPYDTCLSSWIAIILLQTYAFRLSCNYPVKDSCFSVVSCDHLLRDSRFSVSCNCLATLASQVGLRSSCYRLTLSGWVAIIRWGILASQLWVAIIFWGIPASLWVAIALRHLPLKLDCDHLVTDLRFPAELQLSGEGFLLLSFELR